MIGPGGRSAIALTAAGVAMATGAEFTWAAVPRTGAGWAALTERDADGSPVAGAETACTPGDSGGTAADATGIAALERATIDALADAAGPRLRAAETRAEVPGDRASELRGAWRCAD